MISEAQMAQTLERSSNAYEIAVERDMEHMMRDEKWRAFYLRKH
jgi:hypothetical protein